MQWTLPGTVIQAPREDAEFIEKTLGGMFIGGGIMLGQICEVTGLEYYMVQNWVKRGFLPAPDHKRYNLNQLCRVININMLRKVLPIEQILALLQHINGELDDSSDDLIDDSHLYFMCVKLAARARYIGGTESWDDALEQITANYREPKPGARVKLIAVLRIMLTAWVASTLSEAAERMVAAL